MDGGDISERILKELGLKGIVNQTHGSKEFGDITVDLQGSGTGIAVTI
jgi:hypothetical protein